MSSACIVSHSLFSSTVDLGYLCLPSIHFPISDDTDFSLRNQLAPILNQLVLVRLTHQSHPNHMTWALLTDEFQPLGHNSKSSSMRLNSGILIGNIGKEVSSH